MNLLQVDSSILGPSSVSRQVSAAIVRRLAETKPGLTVVRRDLAETPPVHLGPAHVAARFGAPPKDAKVEAELAEGAAALTEFLAADIVVIGAPMYNFTVPTQLKAWIDQLLIAGKTFRYTDKGAVGLAGGKRVIVALSRGGLYGPGAPAEVFEHLETYLRSVFAFIGVTDIEFITAEGIQLGPDRRAGALDAALRTASNLAPVQIAA